MRQFPNSNRKSCSNSGESSLLGGSGSRGWVSQDYFFMDGRSASIAARVPSWEMAMFESAAQFHYSFFGRLQ